MQRFMESLGKDRRLAERHEVKTSLRLRVRKSSQCEQKVESENISRRGVFFRTDLQLNEGRYWISCWRCLKRFRACVRRNGIAWGTSCVWFPANRRIGLWALEWSLIFMWYRMRRNRSGLRGRGFEDR